MKTARFTELVAAGGRPQIHLTWTEPASDRALQEAAKQSRVLTIHRQTRGGKKDYAAFGPFHDGLKKWLRLFFECWVKAPRRPQ